jgi:RNA polymerase sigma-70 factor (ECF subfamily)
MVGRLSVGEAKMNEKIMEDGSYVEAARQGELEAFNQLVLKYQDAAYNQAYWILKDPYRAEEIVQDAFLQAYRNLSRFRNGSFRAWLLRIVINACLDELGRRKRRPLLSLTPVNDSDEEKDMQDWLEDRGPSVEEIIEQSELSAEIQFSLSNLPVVYRTVLVMVDLMDFDYAEAAEALGVPVGTVKSRLARARLHLRRRLERSSPLNLPRQFSQVKCASNAGAY